MFFIIIRSAMDIFGSVAFDYRGEAVVELDKLRLLCPRFFNDVPKKNTFKVIQKRNIPEEDYFVCKAIDAEKKSYGPCEPDDPGRSVLVKVSYLLTTKVFKEKEGGHHVVSRTTTGGGGKNAEHRESAPAVLELVSEEEIFRDEDGTRHNLELRGERSFDRCFVRLSDIGAALKHTNIKSVVTRAGSPYKEGVHYVKFFVPERNAVEVFLPLFSLFLVLGRSQLKDQTKLVEWFTRKVFVPYMGTGEDRSKQCLNGIGMPTDIVKWFTGKVVVGKMPGLFLFAIAPVQYLREVWEDIPSNIPNSDWVCALGATEDLAERTEELRRECTKMINRPTHSGQKRKQPDGQFQLRLIYYARIEPRYLEDAKKHLTERLQKSRFSHQGNKPHSFYALSSAMVSAMRYTYTSLEREFGRCFADLRRELVEEREKCAKAQAVVEERGKRIDDLQTSLDMLNRQHAVFLERLAERRDIKRHSVDHLLSHSKTP